MVNLFSPHLFLFLTVTLPLSRICPSPYQSLISQSRLFFTHGQTFFSSVNNPQPRLHFSFLSGIFSIFSTFLSSSHLIYLSILYSPQSIVNIFSFYLNLPLFTLFPRTRSRFCPFCLSILPLSLFIPPKKVSSLALCPLHFSLFHHLSPLISQPLNSFSLYSTLLLLFFLPV